MVIADATELKEKLKLAETIEFSKHAEIKINTRKIPREFIIENLRNPRKLESFSYEPDTYPGEKYELYFSLNKRRGLKVVVSISNGHLNVVTAHIISRKRMRWVRKWQKKRR